MAGQNYFDQFDRPTPQQQKNAAAEARANAAERRAEEASARAAVAEGRAAEEFALKYGTKGAPGDTSKTGADYLASLPPGLAAQVKMLAEGRLAFPTGAALRSPRAMELVAAASQYDPTLDATNAATRIATRKNFTSGKARQNITSLNTALSHLGSLQQTIAKLDNTGFPWWNAVANKVAVQTGDTKLAGYLKDFETERLAVGEELGRAFKGAAPTMGEAKDWKDTFSSADSPAALNAAVKAGVKLLSGRLQSLQDEYQQGMGRSVDPISFLSPQSQNTYNRLLGNPPAREPGRPRSPLEPGAFTTEIAEPGQQQVIGQQEIEATAKLQDALDRGASADELQKMASQLYGGKGHLDPASLNAALQFRDKFLQNGGVGPSGAMIAPPERKPTAEETQQLETLNDPMRTAIANLGSALTANIAPEFMDEKTRANLQYMSEKSPNAAFLGQVAGSIAPTGLAAKGLARAGLAPVQAALAADTLYGTASGAAWAGEGNRISGALMGGTAGFGGGVAGRYAIAPVVQNLASRYLPKLTFSDKAIIGGRAGDIDVAESKLREAQLLGLPYGLADTGQTAAELASRTARYVPAESENLADIYATRQGGAPERAMSAVEEHVGRTISDVKGRETAMRDAAEIAAAPYYDTAFARMAPNDKALDDMLNSQIGRKALRAAYDKAEAEGVDPHALGLDLDMQGEIKLISKPSWETLHWARKGVRDLVEEYRDPVTRSLDLENNPGARNANKFLQRFTSRLENLNPDYKSAQATYAKYITPRDYLRVGLELGDSKFKANDVLTTIKRIDAMPESTPEELALKQQAGDALREGFATRLSNDINAAKNTDPYSVVYGSPLQRTKIELLGINPADFAKTASLERGMAETGRRVIAGSKGAAREQAKVTLTPGDIAQAAAETAISGAPIATSIGLGRRYAVARAAQPLADWFHNLLGSGTTEKRAAELLPRLTGTDPQAALFDIMQARQARAAYDKAVTPLQALTTGITGLGVNVARAGDRREYPYAVNPAATTSQISFEVPQSGDEDQTAPFEFAHGGLAVRKRK